MTKGVVTGIFIAPRESAAVIAVDEVRAVPGKGLEGDRYFKMSKDPSRWDASKEVTLIESEGLEAALQQHGLELEPGEHRRNIVTAGVSLDELVGAEFTVGEVRLRGLENNPPCRHLAALTGKDVLKPLLTRGGIRAQVLRAGMLRVGDEITLTVPEAVG